MEEYFLCVKCRHFPLSRCDIAICDYCNDKIVLNDVATRLYKIHKYECDYDLHCPVCNGK